MHIMMCITYVTYHCVVKLKHIDSFDVTYLAVAYLCETITPSLEPLKLYWLHRTDNGFVHFQYTIG